MVLIFREKRRKVDPKATSEIEEQDEAIDIAADSHLEESHGFEQPRPNKNYSKNHCNTGKVFVLKYQS